MSKPEREGVVMGYETDLARAYDPAALGWMYDDLQCGSPEVTPGGSMRKSRFTEEHVVASSSREKPASM